MRGVYSPGSDLPLLPLWNSLNVLSKRFSLGPTLLPACVLKLHVVRELIFHSLLMAADDMRTTTVESTGPRVLKARD